MWVILPAAYLVLAVAGHAALTRLPFGPNVVVRFIIVGSLIAVGLAAHLVALYGVAVEALSGLLIYALASELYIFLFTLVSNSVSASLLQTLLSGSLSDGSVEDRYSPEEMVDSRIVKLLANGFLVDGVDGYVLTPKGQRTLRLFQRLRRTFRHPERAEDQQPA